MATPPSLNLSSNFLSSQLYKDVLKDNNVSKGEMSEALTKISQLVTTKTGGDHYKTLITHNDVEALAGLTGSDQFVSVTDLEKAGIVDPKVQNAVVALFDKISTAPVRSRALFKQFAFGNEKDKANDVRVDRVQVKRCDLPQSKMATEMASYYNTDSDPKFLFSPDHYFNTYVAPQNPDLSFDKWVANANLETSVVANSNVSHFFEVTISRDDPNFEDKIKQFAAKGYIPRASTGTTTVTDNIITSEAIPTNLADRIRSGDTPPNQYFESGAWVLTQSGKGQVADDFAELILKDPNLQGKELTELAVFDLTSLSSTDRQPIADNLWKSMQGDLATLIQTEPYASQWPDAANTLESLSVPTSWPASTKEQLQVQQDRNQFLSALRNDQIRKFAGSPGFQTRVKASLQGAFPGLESVQVQDVNTAPITTNVMWNTGAKVDSPLDRFTGVDCNYSFSWVNHDPKELVSESITLIKPPTYEPPTRVELQPYMMVAFDNSGSVSGNEKLNGLGQLHRQLLLNPDLFSKSPDGKVHLKVASFREFGRSTIAWHDISGANVNEVILPLARQLGIVGTDSEVIAKVVGHHFKPDGKAGEDTDKGEPIEAIDNKMNSELDKLKVDDPNYEKCIKLYLTDVDPKRIKRQTTEAMIFRLHTGEVMTTK